MSYLRADSLTKIFGKDTEKLAKRFVSGKVGLEDLERQKATLGIANISFEVEKGGSIGIMGDPGSGRSTLVRILAGMEPTTLGSVWLGKRRLRSLAGARGEALRRKTIRLVGTQDRLFPHLTVSENLSMAARLALGRAGNRRVKTFIESMELGNIASKFPSQLTANQTRRALLAQALTSSPKVLLLDGLLDGLPGDERTEMFNVITDLRKELQFALVVTTEDAAIALGVGDSLMIIDKGEMLQTGPALDVILDPESEEVKASLAGHELGDVMTVSALMHTPAVVRLGTTLTSQAIKTLETEGHRFAAVVDPDHKFIGVVTRNDLRAAAREGGDLTNRIKKPPLIGPDEKVRGARTKLLEQDLPLAIVDEGESYIGLLSRPDLLQLP